MKSLKKVVTDSEEGGDSEDTFYEKAVNIIMGVCKKGTRVIITSET